MENRFTMMNGETGTQGFLSHCLEAIGQARLTLHRPSDTTDAKDNFLNVHLASVLAAGLRPNEEVVDRILGRNIDFWSYFLRLRFHQELRTTALAHGRIAMFMHGIGLLGPAQEDEWGYHRLAGRIHDAYIYAGNTYRSDEVEQAICYGIAEDVDGHSQLIQAAGHYLDDTSSMSTVNPALQPIITSDEFLERLSCWENEPTLAAWEDLRVADAYRRWVDPHFNYTMPPRP